MSLCGQTGTERGSWGVWADEEEEEDEEAGSNTLADPLSIDISINALQEREMERVRDEYWSIK